MLVPLIVRSHVKIHVIPLVLCLEHKIHWRNVGDNVNVDGDGNSDDDDDDDIEFCNYIKALIILKKSFREIENFRDAL